MPGVDYFRTNNGGPTTQRRQAAAPRPSPPPSPRPEVRRSSPVWTHTPGGVCTLACQSPGGDPCAACAARQRAGVAGANFVPHDSKARETQHFPSRPSTLGPGEYLGVPEFGAESGGTIKRPAPKPFDATSIRKSAFDPKIATPGPTDYEPEAADPLTKSVANAKSISLPGTRQSVDMDHLYYDRALIGPGSYEQLEESAQRASQGQGYKSNFVGGTGRQAIDPAELAVRNGMPFACQHPDALPTPGPTDYDPDHNVERPGVVAHDMAHTSYPSRTLDHLQYDHTLLGPGTYDPSHKLTKERAPTTCLSTREELHSDGRLRHWLPRDKHAVRRGPTDYEPPRSQFDMAAAKPGDPDIPNDGAAGNTCKSVFLTQACSSARPENTVPGGLRYESAMGTAWRPAVPWTVGPGSYPPYDPEAEAMEEESFSRGFGAKQKTTVPFNFSDYPKQFFEKTLSVGAKPVPGPGSYAPTDHCTLGHGQRKPSKVPPTVQTSPAHSFPKSSGPEATSSKFIDPVTKKQVAAPSARSTSTGLTTLVQVATGHAASAGGTAQGVSMEHLYRDETLVGPGSYQPGWGPNDPSTDTGADRGPRSLRDKVQANFAHSVEGMYSRASTSGYMSETCGWATGSPGGPPMRVRRATPRWGDWDARVAGPWQWHDDEGAKRARAREPRVPGPGTYDTQQYESLRPRVRDTLILPEKGASPAYSPAATANTQSDTQHASHRLNTQRRMMRAERKHARQKSGAQTDRPSMNGDFVFNAPACSPGVGEQLPNRHRIRTPSPPPPPRVPTPEEELDAHQRLQRRELQVFKKIDKGNFADAAEAARTAMERMEMDVRNGTLKFKPRPTVSVDQSLGAGTRHETLAGEPGVETSPAVRNGDVLANPESTGGPMSPSPDPEPPMESDIDRVNESSETARAASSAATNSTTESTERSPQQAESESAEDRAVRLYLVMLQAAYNQHQHDEVYRILTEAQERYPENGRLAAFSASFQAAVLSVISPPVSEVSDELVGKARRVQAGNA